jgi:hypothetical protein
LGSASHSEIGGMLVKQTRYKMSLLIGYLGPQGTYSEQAAVTYQAAAASTECSSAEQ